ncbi:hypothetical protein IB655_04180 [Francisella noatunensis]|uniref:Uncharacterized protein n=1 Tax=Francisella noatunensis TaxID=657445 RepID=A0A9Q2KVE0_9GAMM|nr:hypothetical protein [Francisella noatunensis]MBK2029263.1 hypothetical protein [Francisella noatunensis]MBK2034340.1 hypothetical protein [Francisella noatunensis]MBK2049252.1 hypothetical protein [Francisella noatunensis]MBK2050171.1 hypothetical protein [Francisella noatunensis]MBK2051549.1 hypothetical protein [Francisella noatunensis]
MATIFHKGRKILRSEIGNHNYAEIADLLFFRIQISKYKERNGDAFFLLPNIEYLAEETGIKKRTCERALTELAKNGFISKSKTRCYDGAVRLKIFITSKFKALMDYINSLVSKPSTENKTQNIDINTEDVTKDYMAESDFATKAESYIKEEDQKDNNINNIDSDYKDIVKNVKFSFEDENTYKLAEAVSNKYGLDCQDILFSLIDLNETNLYNCNYKLIDDAIKVIKRNCKIEDVLPSGDVFNSYKAIEVAEDARDTILTAKQQLAIHQMLNYLNNKGKALISNIKEVFSWIEFQITNPEYQFKGLGFKHCLNIIRNLLCDSSKQQYSKPVGFKGSREL